MSERLLTTREAAAYLAVAPNTLSGWARAGKVPAHRVGNGWRFDRDRLDEHFAAGFRDTWAAPERGRAAS